MDMIHNEKSNLLIYKILDLVLIFVGVIIKILMFTYYKNHDL